ncbi:hypothetical protein [Dactylosporangium sp. CA-233914]|uniref:hypothetical protein n=1 Tax=Dactylosporangium sp. CA-233914 TaxID=3239934 RepID=UPI003D923592
MSTASRGDSRAGPGQLDDGHRVFAPRVGGAHGPQQLLAPDGGDGEHARRAGGDLRGEGTVAGGEVGGADRVAEHAHGRHQQQDQPLRPGPAGELERGERGGEPAPPQRPGPHEPGQRRDRFRGGERQREDDQGRGDDRDAGERAAGEEELRGRGRGEHGDDSLRRPHPPAGRPPGDAAQ